MKNKTVILVAVRLKSKRRKKKAILTLSGMPLILQLTERIKNSNSFEHKTESVKSNKTKNVINDHPLRLNHPLRGAGAAASPMDSEALTDEG